MTEIQKMEKALRKADVDWSSSFNCLEDTMLIIDKGYSIENINNSGLVLLGKSKEEIIGRQCYQVVHGENKLNGYCPCRQALKSTMVESVERYDELFGRHFSVKSTPIFDENGEITRLVCLMSDISQRVKAEEKERELRQELNLASRLASMGELVAGITHEINNPLTSIMAFAQMLARMDISEDIKEAVETINDGAERIAGIVEKLLNFSRRNRPDKELVSINSIITSVIEMRSYEMRINNIKTTTELAADLPGTMANTGQLQQVFLNVIVNAEQAMLGAHKDGELSVKTERIDNNIRVSITDDGPGIAEDNIYKLFDPFFTTKDAAVGTGLGLSISSGIINEHGGKIYAESVLGKGATFIIELPIVTEAAQPPVTDSCRKEPAEVAGAKIMVVDDEPHICRALDRLLSQEKYQVEIISSARVALQKLNEAKYDLILLDIRMPDMNGIEFYNHMKEIDSSLQPKVVCISGDVASARNRAFLDETGIPCIVKPFGNDELMHQVKLVLGGQTNDA